ncbi:hypothetical protein GCM10010442_62250 [Kitasatospora kifunensis]
MGGEDAHQAAKIDLGGAQVLLTFRHEAPVCQSDNHATTGFTAGGRCASASTVSRRSNLPQSISRLYDPIERIGTDSLAADRRTA